MKRGIRINPNTTSEIRAGKGIQIAVATEMVKNTAIAIVMVTAVTMTAVTMIVVTMIVVTMSAITIPMVAVTIERIMITTNIMDTGNAPTEKSVITGTTSIRDIGMIITATGDPGINGTGTPKHIREFTSMEATIVTKKRT